LWSYYYQLTKIQAASSSSAAVAFKAAGEQSFHRALPCRHLVAIGDWCAAHSLVKEKGSMRSCGHDSESAPALEYHLFSFMVPFHLCPLNYLDEIPTSSD
jgi:hypothetical protein